MEPNQNPPSEREWSPQEMEEFFTSQDAVTGVFNGGVANNSSSFPALFENEPLTLKKLVAVHDEFLKAFPIPVAYKNGADMSQATFDELGKSIKLVKPQGHAWLGMNVDNFIGVQIHICNDVPYGVVEECRCPRRKDYLDALEFKEKSNGNS